MTSPICPCCGYNLRAEEPIVAGRFSYSPGRGFMVDGERLNVAPGCHGAIGAVMAARGRVHRSEAITERQKEDFANPSVMLNGYVYRLRRALGERGVEPPFERAPCTGLRWTGPEVERVAA